jgi:hypothetical protein
MIDDFWEEGLKEPVKPAAPPPAAKPAGHAGFAESSARSSSASTAAPPKKRKKKSGGLKWGFDWAKVGGGLITFLIAGGITYGVFMSSGRIYIWPAIAAVGGLFTALSGLMGEDGVW